jgi:hypothetical protein
MEAKGSQGNSQKESGFQEEIRDILKYYRGKTENRYLEGKLYARLKAFGDEERDKVIGWLYENHQKYKGLTHQDIDEAVRNVRGGKPAAAREEEKPTRQYLKCPGCGKKYPLSRRYCDCGAELPMEPVFTKSMEGLGREVNIDDPAYDPRCPACGEGCKKCFSFGQRKAFMDGSGKPFGGEGCYYRKDSPLCGCCMRVIRGQISYKGGLFADFLAANKGQAESLAALIAGEGEKTFPG